MSRRPLDAIDLKIVSILQRDGRITNQDLASEVGLSATPCLERVRRLERDGVIRSYHASVDAEALGLPLLFIVEVILERTSATAYEDVQRAIRELPEVVECYMVTGDVDYVLKVRAASVEQFRIMLQTRILPLGFVKITHSAVVMQEIKSGAPIPTAYAAEAQPASPEPESGARGEGPRPGIKAKARRSSSR
jgi:Lrp/AsnC family leucine-responsive transcriptional regulator